MEEEIKQLAMGLDLSASYAESSSIRTRSIREAFSRS